MADKKFLRREYLEKRKSFSLKDLSEASRKIVERLKEIPLWEKDFYHLFLPIRFQNEINTFCIFEYLKERSKKIILSKTDFFSGNMHFFLWHPDMKICENAYGIPEPTEGVRVNPLSIEVAFIPLLAFDIEGYRLGYGKGFYDRFLASCSKNLYKVGLSLFNPLTNLLKVHSGDIPLNIVVTPDRAYLF